MAAPPPKLHRAAAAKDDDDMPPSRLITIAEDRIGDIERELSDQSAALKKIQTSIGASPDPALGTPGSGICGQLSTIVQQHAALAEAQRKRDADREKLNARLKVLASIATIIGGVIAVLHLFHVL